MGQQEMGHMFLEDADVKSQEVAAEVVDTTYADDTLLASSSIPDLQVYLNDVIQIAHGLKPNWKKTLHLRLRHDTDLLDSDGQPIPVTYQAVYLGSLLTTSGLASPSLSRRLGEARGAFEKLQLVWRHANISKPRKVQIYSACILSKLL